MSDVAWGIVGVLAGTIIGAATTITVEYFSRRSEKRELKIQTLSAISAIALKQYRLVRNVIEMVIEVEKASATASLISKGKMIQYKSDEARLIDQQVFLKDRDKYLNLHVEYQNSLDICDSELRELRTRYMILYPSDSETPELIQEIIEYNIFDDEVKKPSREEFEKSILSRETDPSDWVPDLWDKNDARFKPILDRLKSQIDERTIELAK